MLFFKRFRFLNIDLMKIGVGNIFFIFCLMLTDSFLLAGGAAVSYAQESEGIEALRVALEKYKTVIVSSADSPKEIRPLCVAIDDFVIECKERLDRSGWSSTFYIPINGAPLEEQLKKLATDISAGKYLTGILEKIKIALKRRLDYLSLVREGIMLIHIRIARTDLDLKEALREMYVRAFGNEESTMRAYEYLNLKSDDRKNITITEVNDAILRVGKEIDLNSAIGKLWRQAVYVLRHPIGKENYDAFLTGDKAISILRIDPTCAQKIGLDLGELMQKIEELFIYSSSLDEVITRINDQLLLSLSLEL